MNSTKLFSVLAIGAVMFAQAQSQQDVKAIKAMTGCYEVSFNFAETFVHQKDYEKKKITDRAR